MLCQHSCFTTHLTVKAAPESNKNSCKHEEEWGQAEQTCLRIEICYELSHNQALAHSCLLLRFLSAGGDNSRTSVAFVCGIIFHRCPHRLHMGHGPVTLLDVLILLQAEFCNPLQREREREKERDRVQAKQGDSIATGRHVQTMLSMSSPCGSGDSLQQHIIIIRIQDFIMESFFFFFLPPSLTWSPF